MGVKMKTESKKTVSTQLLHVTFTVTDSWGKLTLTPGTVGTADLFVMKSKVNSLSEYTL